MNVQNSICSAFCSGLSVREIPIGYAIKTPFSWLHGEPLVVFGEVDRGMVRMRDSGDTLMFLEDVAGDLTMDSRIDAMREIALEHGVQFDEDNALFVSDWVDKSQLGDSAVRFMSFLKSRWREWKRIRLCGSKHFWGAWRPIFARQWQS